MKKQKLNKYVEEFATQFTDLLNYENACNSGMPEDDEALSEVALYFATEFSMEPACSSDDGLYFFVFTVCYPYSTELEDDDNELLEEKLKNWIWYTVNEIVINHSEHTRLLTSVRMFYLLIIGLQLKCWEDDYFKTNLLEILKLFSTKYPTPIVPWSFIVQHYPCVEEDKDAIKLGLEISGAVDGTDMIEAIFDE